MKKKQHRIELFAMTYAIIEDREEPRAFIFSCERHIYSGEHYKVSTHYSPGKPLQVYWGNRTGDGKVLKLISNFKLQEENNHYYLIY